MQREERGCSQGFVVSPAMCSEEAARVCRLPLMMAQKKSWHLATCRGCSQETGQPRQSRVLPRHLQSHPQAGASLASGRALQGQRPALWQVGPENVVSTLFCPWHRLLSFQKSLNKVFQAPTGALVLGFTTAVSAWAGAARV